MKESKEQVAEQSGLIELVASIDPEAIQSLFEALAFFFYCAGSMFIAAIVFFIFWFLYGN